MRHLAILALAATLTGCAHVPCMKRRPAECGPCLTATTRKPSPCRDCNRDEPCRACRAACSSPSAAACSSNPKGCFVPAAPYCRRTSTPTMSALRMDWAHLPIPVLKVQKFCVQPVSPCRSDCRTVDSGYAQSSDSQKSQGPNGNPFLDDDRHAFADESTQRAFGDVPDSILERTDRLRNQVRELKDLIREQSGIRQTNVPALPPAQQGWGPDDGVPALPDFAIEQTSGTNRRAGYRSASTLKMWPHSPQYSTRR